MADSRIKKHNYAVYLNNGTSASPSWVRIEKATDFTRALNVETEERNYIADEHATTVIKEYKPSEGLTVDCYKGNPDFEMFYELYKSLATGTDAEKEMLLVSKFDPVEVEGVTDPAYYAELCKCSIAVGEFNVSESQMSVTVYENGNKTAGYAVYGTDGLPEFTADEN